MVDWRVVVMVLLWVVLKEPLLVAMKVVEMGDLLVGLMDAYLVASWVDVKVV